jgi:rare lipoprotein A
VAWRCRLLRALPQVMLVSAAIVSGTGCRHKPAPVAVAPPPVLTPPAPVPSAPSSAPVSSPAPAPNLSGSIADNEADAAFVASHPVIYNEVGNASWYGPPYDKRRGANGEIFDKDALTAAHRTLPMNSLIRVTNLSTGQSVILHITDRGPFVPDRILDLSLASAKAIGVWRPGVARVRVEVFAAPSSLDRGGRWCVQIGAFKSERESYKLRDQLARKYSTAKVIEFTGPTGHWVRIRPAGDDKGRAVEIARGLQPSEGEAYLVRLD